MEGGTGECAAGRGGRAHEGQRGHDAEREAEGEGDGEEQQLDGARSRHG